MTSAEPTGRQPAPSWPTDSGPYVLLVDASSGIEAKIIADWCEEATAGVTDPVSVFRLPPSRRKRPFASVDPAIDERLSQSDDPLVVPVRIVWLAREHEGTRKVTLRDALRFGDPRDPIVLQQRRILATKPERCRIVVGEPARKSELTQVWSSSEGRGPADGTTIGEFVALRAWLALERAERHLRGQRYKVPRFLYEDLFWSRRFQRGTKELAISEDRTESRMQGRTKRYLKEIAAQHSPYVIDLVNAVTTLLIKNAHQSVEYSSDDLKHIFALGEQDPLIFLPSHKSNFDHLVFQYVLYENELPQNHTAGGINMNFFLIGPLLRRSGIFFIRRQFKDNEPYKFVLRQYLDYLLEKRFALEWYIEGGRSRTGKLREPRIGLLRYVTDSYQRGIVDDIVLVPVSINYDQIADASSYAHEQRGGAKQKESLGWALRFITGLRKKHGAIHIRFGAPLRMSSRIDVDEDLTTDDGRLALPKVAFEVSTRINEVTPITPISLVTLALLSGGSGGLTVGETIEVVRPFVTFVRERGLPTTFDDSFDSPIAVEAALEALSGNGVVERTEGLTDIVYSIGPDQSLLAAYYRNTVIHFFVNIGITELAIAMGVTAQKDMDQESILRRALELRDLFKFEFFFAPTEQFEAEILLEIDRYRIDDESVHGPVLVDVDAMTPAKSPVVLRPFLEAYFVVASALATMGDAPTNKDSLADACLAMGNQLLAKGVIVNSEAVSTTLFASGIELAANRDLLDGTTKQRDAFLDEVTEVLGAVTDVATL
ncbi:MAG: 1-acyl-sn-glycerol-3-phosphate acyltransferase [Acidimicrobiia bacterium]